MKISNIMFLILLLEGISTPCYSSTYDSVVAAYIKKEQFNLELYEISFCAKELLEIIEKDSISRNAFEKRISRAFDKKLNEAQVYFHTLEYHFLQKQVLALENVRHLYPQSLSLIEKMAPSEKKFDFEKFSIPFENYIEYPEQTDDACLILLVSGVPDEVWSDIQSNELAMYRFNSWLEFGFEEFRYYPGTKSVPKSRINSRIVHFINERYDQNTNPFIVKSLKAINSVVERYRRKR